MITDGGKTGPTPSVALGGRVGRPGTIVMASFGPKFSRAGAEASEDDNNPQVEKIPRRTGVKGLGHHRREQQWHDMHGS
jgi:hypothetical protein